MRGKKVKVTAKTRAKATLGYNAHRPGKDNEKMDRVLFGNRETLTEEQALRMIEQADKRMLFFRMKLNPDPKTENRDKKADLWKISRELVAWLEAKLGREVPLIGVEHDDHSDKKHVHAILLSNGGGGRSRSHGGISRLCAR